jgi:hypothetical protein
MPSVLRAPFSERATVVALRLICFCGLLLANYYSWTMTVTGFANTKLLPDNSVLSTNHIPLVVAGFIQLGILAFYLSFPYFQRRYIHLNLLAAIFAGALILVTVVFSVFSITLTSQAESIVSHQVNLIRGMNKTLLDLDELISTTFRNQLVYYDALAKRACEGKDKSGIAQCGPIARSYHEKSNEAGAKFGSQLGAGGNYSGVDSDDLLTSLNALRGNYVKFAQKVDIYKNFAREHELSSEAVSRAFDSLKNEIDAFARSLNQKNPDAKALVLSRVFEDFGALLRGDADGPTYFALVVALLPDLLSVTFTVVLLIARNANEDSVVLRRAIVRASDEAKWYDQYADATAALHRAQEKWRDKRRLKNVAEAVDQSVPDTWDRRERVAG